ncbi:putative disease resistance protein RGA4 [Oryza glaberrima]|uniref:putative disease resistance protein RGA4 n=1 Tax=Oryza glaberrima TaxID=4538 RepID=UPI00224C01B5|nr:putative disease resistance protein RGA4 [Oryza glaberrima]
MAIVLDAFASYVGDLLKQVAQDELTLLLGVSGEIASLHERLNSLKDYLADAERRRITDQSVQGWVRKLKDVMYDVTDILDLCHLKAMQHGGVGSSAPPVNISCLDSLLFCLRNPLFAHDIGSRIKALNARLDAICKSAAAFSFLKLEAYEDMAAPRRPSAADRKTDPVLERSAVVGEKIEEDTRTLVKMLTNGKNKKQNAVVVVAVVGTGGIGKTTLAKKVFNDEAIKEAFDKKIWLSVTQDVNEVELLRTAIRSVSVGGASNGRESNKSLLVPTLVDAIRDKRFFLVLDDMWSDRAWSGLLKVPFSHGAAGSRVLVTTRHDAVARGMQAMHPFHHVDKLCPPDAWSLLKKQVVSSEMEEVEIDETLKDIGMEIIDKCGGLPLAVKVMGGLLCKKERRRADWEKILHDSIWSVPQMPELNYTIYLSYQDLHPCLKQCFLHYSLLPKNVDFFIDTVTSMWISEGFLHGETDDLEQLGEECYKELIYRNLIEPNAEYAGEWVSTMHDVVRSFAQHLARDEALVISSRDEIGRGALKSHKFLRLSIETDDLQPNDEFGWKIIQGQKSLRTLILVGELKINPGDSLITLSSLRTLHIENVNCTSTLVESLHQLKHLRYISLKCGDITRLPENIGKMRFLQYLGLVCENLGRLPNSIVKLGQLRYLDLSGTSITSIPRGFCGLTSLRTLYGFPTQVDGDWCSLQELGPLAQLWVLGLSNLENVPAISFAAKARLGEKAHLSYLMLECSSRLGEDGFVEDENGVPAEEQRQIEEVFNALTPPLCIESIEISGHFGEQLPRWMMSRVACAYERLSMVIMDDLACCNQLPDGLCRLPSLYYFQLTHAPAIKRVGPEFLTILPSSSQLRQAHAFPRLKRMILIGMVEWEEWEWDQQLNSVHAMPALEELVIENCKLRRLPPGLSSQATALTSLYLRNIQQLNSVESFASLVKLEVYDNPNLESITSLNRLQKLVIDGCPKMRILEGVPELLRLELKDLDMEELPGYLLQSVSPRHLLLDCSLEMLTAISTGESGPEWSKLSRVQHLKAYADQGDNERRWHVLYTRDPYRFETNIGISSSSSSGESRDDEE